MKKLTLTIIIGITAIFQSFGQLNPIHNFNWEHWYVCPVNYFRLTWDIPNPSQDTLIGYNIYRDTELYRFQTDTILNYEPSGGNCGEDFFYYGVDGFWCHITAVYNSAMLQSGYYDSAFVLQLISGSEDVKQSKSNLFPNPTTGKFIIDIRNVKRVFVIDETGKILKENIEKTEIDLSNLPKGIYFIKVITGQGELVEKIILE